MEELDNATNCVIFFVNGRKVAWIVLLAHLIFDKAKCLCINTDCIEPTWPTDDTFAVYKRSL